jgi:sulfonate transport system permease protein
VTVAELEFETIHTDHLVKPRVRVKGGHSKGRTLAVRSLVPAAVLGLWCLLTYSGAVRSEVLPSPSVVVSTVRDLWTHQQLGDQLRVSLTRAIVGFAIGGGIGLVLGLASGLSLLGEELVDAPMQMLRMVPFLALVPLFILPLALPQILTGIRFSLGISILALVAAEQINSNLGVGHLMLNAQNYNQLNVVFVCVLLYVVFGIAADVLVRVIEHVSMPWRAGVAVR